MLKKSSSLDECLEATILADIFGPSGSNDIDFVTRKIIDGLDSCGMIKSKDFDNEDSLAA